MATITIELPDAVIQELAPSSGEISKRVLEAVVLEGHRTERYSRGEVAQLFGLSWHETEQFLAEHGLPYHYTLEDLDEDRQTLDELNRLRRNLNPNLSPNLSLNLFPTAFEPKGD